MSKIGVVYEQARRCECGGGSVPTYRVQGLEIISPRAYDKQSAEHLATAYQEIEDLKDKIGRAYVGLLRYESRHDRDVERKKLFQEVKDILLLEGN